MNSFFRVCVFGIFAICLLTGDADAQSYNWGKVYKLGDFLIHAKDTMAVELITKNPDFKNPQNRDTLYDDPKYLLLGNADMLLGVYKKYKVGYDFSSYKVNVYHGKLALPDFKTDTSAHLFRTQIINQCKTKGVNFAGHFTLVQWGCGTECRETAIVDRITGKIFYYELKTGYNYAFNTIAHKSNSSMVIMNDWMLERFKGYVRYDNDYWKLKIAKWNDTKFQVLAVQE